MKTFITKTNTKNISLTRIVTAIAVAMFVATNSSAAGSAKSAKTKSPVSTPRKSDTIPNGQPGCQNGCPGNNGNGNGNTGPGNQGNDGTNGNAGGGNNGGGNNGGSDNGGGNNGGGNNGGSDNGGGNNGGGNNGGSDNGGGNNGGGNNGGSDNGGGNNGGGNNGGSDNGGGNNGGGNNGGSDNGGGNNGGGNNGGGNNGGSDNGGGNNGGGNNGGSDNGGGNNGGGNNGGSDNGGGNNGGGNNGGSDNGGGNNGGGNNGGSDNGGGNNGGGNNGGSDNGGGNNGGGNNGGSDNGGGNNGGGNNGGSDNGGGNNGGGNNGGSDNGGGNNGGGNNGGSDNGGGNNGGETPKQSQLRSKWEPMFYLDIDLSRRRITNLTPHDASKATAQPMSVNSTEKGESLVYGDYRNGFRVVTVDRLEAGSGARLLWFYQNETGLKADVWRMVGLMPVGGAEVVNVRHVKSLKDAHTINKAYLVPSKLEELSNWSDGDSLMFSKKGGLLFISGLGVNITGVSGMALAQGVWETAIERESDRTALVRIGNTKTKEVAAIVGTTFASVGVSGFNGKGKQFIFRINTTHKDANKVYSDLINGNVAAIQSMAEQGSDIVESVENEKNQRRGTARHAFFGIPILANTSWAWGKVQSFSEKNLNILGAKAEVHYGIYSRDRQTSLGLRQRTRAQGFYGAKYRLTTGENEVLNGYFGRYFWNFSDNNSSEWHSTLGIRELNRRTGLKTAFLAIPKVKDLDTMAFSIEMTFGQSHTDKLMATAERMSSRDFQKLGEKLQRDYFSRMLKNLDRSQDIYDLCSKGTELDACRRDTEKSTRFALSKMWSALKEMSQARNDSPAFTKAYAQFGQGLSKNPFALQTALQIAGAGVQARIEMSGTHISLYRALLQTTSQSGVFDLVREENSPQAMVTDLAVDQNYTQNKGVVFATGKQPYVNAPVLPK